MKLIVGLGNPGKKYSDSRHNVGFMVIDSLVSKISKYRFPVSNWEESKNAKALYCKTRIKRQEIEFVKPQTFMNNSGISVRYAYKKHSIVLDELFVVHDDLDIKLGEYKVQKDKGPREHNGLTSIYEKLGSKDFWHVRIGIENRVAKVNKVEQADQVRKLSGQEYVLQNFPGEELVILEKTIKAVTDELFSKIAG